MEETLNAALDSLRDLGITANSITQLNSGRNSKTYKLTTEKLKSFALKLYPAPNHADPRNRCKTEVESIAYLNTTKSQAYAKILAYDLDKDWALFEWIHGTAVTNLNSTDILEIVDFICKSNSQANSFMSNDLQYASEACTTLKSLATNILARLETLKDLIDSSNIDCKALDWIHTRLTPSINYKINYTLNKAECSHWHTENIRFLFSQSDIGIHNMIHGTDMLYFIDYEYAGLDDIPKLIADLALQPECMLSKQNEDILIQSILKRKITKNASWVERYHDIRGLIGLKWCLIIIKRIALESEWQSINQKALNYYENLYYSGVLTD